MADQTVRRGDAARRTELGPHIDLNPQGLEVVDALPATLPSSSSSRLAHTLRREPQTGAGAATRRVLTAPHTPVAGRTDIYTIAMPRLERPASSADESMPVEHLASEAEHPGPLRNDGVTPEPKPRATATIQGMPPIDRVPGHAGGEPRLGAGKLK
jgi:hypothetical protein